MQDGCLASKRESGPKSKVKLSRGESGAGVGLLGALSLSGRQSVVLLLGDGNGQMGLISLKISHQLQEVSISHHLEPL